MKERRGRKSAASRDVATLANKISDVTVINYLDPPYELTEDEANTWRSVVQDCAPDWFTAKTIPLLSAYCRHVCRANRIAFMIRQYEEDMDRAARGQATIGCLQEIGYDKLLDMEAKQSRQIAMLATKMRIAQQSTIDEQSAKARVGKKSTLWLRPTGN